MFPPAAPQSCSARLVSRLHSRSQAMRAMLLLLGLWTSWAPADTNNNLPSIGDAGGAVLSRAEEEKLGRVILSQIRKQLPLVNDPEITNYVQSLGTKILSAGVDNDSQFTFLVVNDSNINAFATPGGIIVVNSGLIMLTESEAELASVVSHEIGHVVQRHIARSIEGSKGSAIATGVGLLASILAGLYNPQVGSAALYSTLGASAQSQLAFSRKDEQEADRVGLQLMAEARFDPQGMPTFFTKLYKFSESNSSLALEFVSSHPLTPSRISDTKDRADQYTGKFNRDSQPYEFARARTQVLAGNPDYVIQRYEHGDRGRPNNQMAERYAYALSLIRTNNPDKALPVLKSLQVVPEVQLYVDLAYAQAYMTKGDFSEASRRLKRLDEIYPGQEAVTLYLARCMINMGQFREALHKVDPPSRQPRHNPEYDKLKAEASERIGLDWLSHESLADYYLAYGQYDRAIEQINIALNDPKTDAGTITRLKDRKDELRELERESRK